MSQSAPKISLRPPPHRDFLTGHPGIPASNPSSTLAPPSDPLLSLPFLNRPAAALTGTVEIKLPQGKTPFKARWLRVELEKMESVPGSAEAKDGGKSQINHTELIGSGPGTLWEAGQDIAEEDSPKPTENDSGKKAKRFVSLVKRGTSAEEDDEEGWGVIPEGKYSFSIPLPEGLPPTTEVDSKGNGISYQLVATLCGKSKAKSILRATGSKSTFYTASAGVLLLKAETLPTWPIFGPILGSALARQVPWASEPESTTGETKESRTSVIGSNGDEGVLWMRVTRERGALGPGDECQIYIEMRWEGLRSLKVTRLDFVLREVLACKSPNSLSGSSPRGIPRVSSIFTSHADSQDPDDPATLAVLYPHELFALSLTGTVPTSHPRVTVRTAKYIDVSYHLKIRAMIDGGTELAVDDWPIILGSVGRRESNGLLTQIGYVEGLCERPTTEADTQAQSTEASPQVTGLLPRPSRSPDLPSANPLVPASSPAQNGYVPRFAHLYATRTVSPSAQDPYHFSPESHTPQRLLAGANDRYSTVRALEHPPSTPSPTPRPKFSPSPTAAEEKQRLHQEAVAKREEAQARRVMNEEEEAKHEEARRRQSESLASPVSRTSDAFSSVRSSSSQYTHHEIQSAAVIRRQLVQDGLAKPPHRRSEAEKAALDSLLTSDGLQATVAQGHLAPIGRSNTTMARSGSSVGGDVDRGASPSPSPSATPIPAVAETPVHPLLRSKTILTGAEAEKRRLYEEAKARAVQRQEEAAREVQRQAELLASLEAEENARAEADYELELAAAKEEERRRARALAERDEFERQERERALLLEQEWRRAEEERQRKSRADFEERMRQEEARRVEELRRLAEQHREVEEESKAEMLRRRQERDRLEEARRLEAERIRMEHEQQEEAARRALEQQRQEEEEASRRQLEDNKRRAYEARLAEEQAGRRWQEEQARLAQEEHARRQAEERQWADRQEEQRRQLEDEHQRLSSSQRSYHPHQLYDPPLPREPSSFVPSSAHRSTPSGLDSRGYPQGYGQYQSTRHHSGGPALARSNSFAPQASASEADVNFYAAAIANSATPSADDAALSEEKAAYVRRLRGAEEARKAGMSGSVLGHQPAYESQAYSNGAVSDSFARHVLASHPSRPYNALEDNSAPAHLRQPSHLYPQLSAVDSPVESSIAQQWGSQPETPPRQQQPWSSQARPVSLSAVGGRAPMTDEPVPQLPTSSSATIAAFKSAKEEKDEEEARRVAADRARLVSSSAAPAAASAPDEDFLPSYPQGSSSSALPPTASQEKTALNAYMLAKAAVEAQQQAVGAPPLPPSRSGVATAPSAPLYPISEGQQNGQYPQLEQGRSSSPPRAARPTRRDSGSESSAELHRDPSIAAGKRPVHVSRSVSGTTIYDSMSPSAPPLTPQPHFHEASAPNEQ